MRNVVICALACHALWGGSAAAFVLNDGDCINPSGASLFITATKRNFDLATNGYDSLANDRKQAGEVITLSGAGINHSNRDIFCRCDDTLMRQWANMSEYTAGHTPVLTVEANNTTYRFIDILDEESNKLPFYVGMTVYHTGTGEYYPGIPATTIVGSQTRCVQDDTLQGDELYTGRETTDTSANRQYRFVISPKTDNMAPGSYNFTMPEVRSYRKLIDVTATTNENWSSTPEAIVNTTFYSLIVHKQCTLTAGSVFSVDLGAVESNAFDAVAVGEKPDNYEDREINIELQCNGVVDNQVADFYITDGNDVSNTTDTLTTNLDGVGVAIEDVTTGGVGRITMQARYENKIALTEDGNGNGNGRLELKAYPVKVAVDNDEDGTDDGVTPGIYRAKATLIIENH